MASHSGTSSGPFTVTVSNLPFGWGGLISISVQRLTCPRQRPFEPSHQGWYPASYPGRPTEGSTMSPRVSCRLSTTGIRLLGILLPPRSSAPLTVGLPSSQPAPGPDGISTFRTSESRPDWVPSLPRGHAVLPQPVRSLRPPLAPSSRGRALSPRYSSHLPELSITRRHQGFTCVHPPGLPPRLLVPGWNRDPLGLIPGFAPQQAGPAAHAGAGDGHRALTRSYTPGITGPPFRKLTRNVRPRVARPAWT
jgi:hypothetical protein